MEKTCKNYQIGQAGAPSFCGYCGPHLPRNPTVPVPMCRYTCLRQTEDDVCPEFLEVYELKRIIKARNSSFLIVCFLFAVAGSAAGQRKRFGDGHGRAKCPGIPRLKSRHKSGDQCSPVHDTNDAGIYGVGSDAGTYSSSSRRVASRRKGREALKFGREKTQP